MNNKWLLSNHKINKIIQSEGLLIKNSTNNFDINLIALDFLNSEKSLFVVLPNLYNAQKYYDELINILDEEDVLFYPADELITAQMLISSGDFKLERINTITTLINTNDKKLIITHLNGAIKYQLPKNIWSDNIINIKVNDIIDTKELLEKLVCLGYEHTYTVSRHGQFSKRGGIIDIFPVNYHSPVRLDFFDDELEKIKTFDVDSQRSIEDISEVKIIPITELIFDNETLKLANQKFSDFIKNNNLSEKEEEKFKSDLVKLTNRQNLDILYPYMGFISDVRYSIFDFVEDKKVYLINKDNMDGIYESTKNDLENYCFGINGYNLLKLDYFIPIEKLYNIKHHHIAYNDNYNENKEINIFAKETANYNGSEKRLVLDLQNMVKSKTIVVSIKDKTRFDNFKNTCINNNINFTINSINNLIKYSVNIVNDYIPSFELQEEDLIVLSEKTIFTENKNQKKAKYKSVLSNATKINRYDELQIGDFVVHYDHGIGKYLGLKTMEVEKIKRDYIHIEYEGNAALYIPLEQISLIQKYSLAEVKEVKLSSLGSPAWAKAKARIKKRVSELKDKLIALYAKRQNAKGFAFLPDTTDQVLFEADFPYELTQDQDAAVEDVKKDMESIKPMDRLVCGDVGYGKTEVAQRAAFKAVCSAKQVAVLAPTTILSRQHYHSFKDRMSKFGMNVALLNRFVTAKEQKQILLDLETGKIDVIVGTHKLLSETIKYKDLGLLIIDEEQRFGVSHKEKIKMLKVNVDAITLSATPIPRTLQMSILGIKDLSMIETPPKNRYPVQTYVVKRNDSIIKEAILRELSRDGQVFYLYNNTSDIEDIVFKLKSLVPDANITFAHGKMSKDVLEDVITDFIDKKFDVLVCTTIIETGIDLPNANTLLIHHAPNLGLSQMYQLRGRVGRSNKIAYAYFMYDDLNKLSEKSEERLMAIKELTELGSGYKIAMRDLSIRGAGDILGEDQSGFVESVGIEMYLRILEDELKSDNKPEEETKQLDKSLTKVYTNKYISSEYIDNEDVKIQIHKKIDSLKTMKDLKQLKEELYDRFGKVDEEINIYMHEKLLKNLCTYFDIYKIEHSIDNQVILYMSKFKSESMDGSIMFQKANELSKDIKLTYFNKEIQIRHIKDKDNKWIINLVKYFETLK